MNYLKAFLVSLALTLLIENAAAFLLSERGKRTVLLVSLVNILTNPAAVLMYIILCRIFPGTSGLVLRAPIELAVFVTEALIYGAFSVKKGDVIRRPAVLSLVCNLCSCGAGLLIDLLFL